MDNDLREVIPSHVNDEVAVFRGCTTSEMIVMIVAASAFWVPVTIIVGLLSGQFFMVFGTSMLLILVTVFVLTVVLQAIKIGKPDGFYQHKASLALGRFGLRKSAHFDHDGPLAIDRTECIVLLHRDLKRPAANGEL